MIGHILIIPDGNRRWAKQNHKELVNTYRYSLFNVTTKLIDFFLVKNNCRILTIYIISKENMKNRMPMEIKPIVENEIAVFKYWKKNKKFKKAKIRFKFIGDLKLLPNKFLTAAKSLERSTKMFKDKKCYLLAAYDATDSINKAIKKMTKGSKLNISSYLAPKENIDLVIRTGGDKRLSGAPLLQSSYAEFFFVDDFYPDLNSKKLKEILAEFHKRNRRFGS